MRKKLAWFMIVVVLITTVNMQTVFADGAVQGNSLVHDALSADEKAKLIVSNGTDISYGVESVQYAVMAEGRITVSKQAGVYKPTENRALSKDDMYAVGSISKMFATAAVMKLAESGKVNLDQPVTAYLPDFKMADERYKKITVRMLLNHSSGLMGSSFGSAILFHDNDTAAHDSLLDQLAKQRLKADPGAFSTYCNDGFSLAEILVERVSGMSFTEFLHINFSEPLGLANTKTPQDSFDRAKLAGVYFPYVSNDLPADTVNAIGAGGIYSTAEDLCRFAQIFMKDQGQGSGVISPESAQQMAAEEYKRGIWPEGEGNFGYGLGWDRVHIMDFDDQGIQALNKGGDTMLSHGSLVVLPEKNMAAAVLTSFGSSSYSQAIAETLLMEALAAKSMQPEKGNAAITHGGIGKSALVTEAEKAGGIFQPAVPKPAETAPAVPADLLGYQGYYGSMSGLLKIDISRDGKLTALSPAAPSVKQEFSYRGDGIFTDRLGAVQVSFVKEKNGKVYMKTGGTSVLPGLGQTYSTQYAAQKLEGIQVPQAVISAWQQRAGKNYYVLDEKYTSQVYMAAMPAVNIFVDPNLPGYVGAAVMEGTDKTKSVLEIPGSAGRDLKEYTFYKEKGIEYLFTGANKCISQDAIKEIYRGGSSLCTIPESGEAVWFKIGKKSNTIMTVQIPEQASFAAYTDKGGRIASSAADGKSTLDLDLGLNGMVVFAGAPGSKFLITMAPGK